MDTFELDLYCALVQAKDAQAVHKFPAKFHGRPVRYYHARTPCRAYCLLAPAEAIPKGGISQSEGKEHPLFNGYALMAVALGAIGTDGRRRFETGRNASKAHKNWIGYEGDDPWGCNTQTERNYSQARCVVRGMAP